MRPKCTALPPFSPHLRYVSIMLLLLAEIGMQDLDQICCWQPWQKRQFSNQYANGHLLLLARSANMPLVCMLDHSHVFMCILKGKAFSCSANFDNNTTCLQFISGARVRRRQLIRFRHAIVDNFASFFTIENCIALYFQIILVPFQVE